MATLTLSSANVPLDQFLNDVNISKNQKAESLKIVCTLLKNVLKDDLKYRQMRLENPKIKQNITLYPSLVSYFQRLGYVIVTEDNERLLRIENPNEATMQAAQSQAQAAYNSLSAQLLQKQSSTASTSSTLSEKQKARMLLEEKKRQEKEQDRLARKRTQAQIKMDKHVRENDPNWKPSVSAAAAKNGTVMQTFRDKFGE